MIIDLSSVIKVTGSEIKIDGNVGFSATEFLGESYVFATPLNVKGRVYNNGQSLSLEVSVRGSVMTQCARCLDDVKVDVAYDINELLSQRKDDSDESEDIILFDGYTIELDDIVLDHFLMNISGRYLCRDDCKGLCPKCGHNLNEGDCGCDNEYIDPRWQELADILNQSKKD